MNLLTVENISKSYDGEKVLEDVSIELGEGELISVLGVSGAGKTTLFNIISGLTMPDSGRVFFEGEDVTGKTGRVSYMLQKDLLLPHKTIVDNVALPLILKGENKKVAGERVRGLFDKFGLVGTEDKYPSQLSGGMRQRAALLRTYMFSERVALLDEPFSALDMLTKQSMHNWFLNVMEKIELSAVFVTHDIDEAIMLSDRIYIMTGKPGKITKEIVIDSPKPRVDFNLTEEFLAYKKDILNSLK